MYFSTPPQVIETEVFVRVPEKYRFATAGPKKGQAKCFLEGPSFDRDGNLYCTDIPCGRIFRISPKGEWDLVAEYDGEPNGLKIHKDGRIFIADHKNGILLLDPKRGTVSPVIQGPSKERFKGCNDLIFASNGDLYFTDQGQTGLHDPTGRVYRYTASGHLQCLIDTVPSPNGLVLNTRENALYVAATRANAVWRVPFGPGGSIGAVGLFAQLPCAGPDGMALDEDGDVVVAHPTLGAVWVISKFGIPLYHVKTCSGTMTTNLAYGGPERKTLFITESGNILAAKLPVGGKLMYSHMPNT